MNSTDKSMKMKIDIWSDVVCPFCYISKRRFEKALSMFEHKDDIEVVWHSYQLSPEMITQNDKTLYEYIAERDEITVEDVALSYDFVREMAQEAGLEFHLEKTRRINTKNAHRLLQIAKGQGKGASAEEILFHAYFIDNINIDDRDVLIELAKELSIDKETLLPLLSSEIIDQAVENDIEHAKELGIKGVPYFLIDDEIYVSGAQTEQIYFDAIEKAWTSWHSNIQEKFSVSEGSSCSQDGECKI